MNDEMRLLSDKITTILNNRGWTVMDLSKKAPDIPYDTLKNIIYHKSEDLKSFKTLKHLATALNVTTDFLLDMKTYPEDEMTLLKNYRSMSSHGKHFVRTIAKFEKNYTDYEEEQLDKYELICYLPEVAKLNDEVKYVLPCLEPTGYFQDGVLYDTSKKTYLKTHLENVFMAVKIPNDSLASAYFTDDILLLTERNPFQGEIAIYQKDNHIYIRKFKKEKNTFILESLNKSIKNLELTATEFSKYHHIGTCIYLYRKKEHLMLFFVWR